MAANGFGYYYSKGSLSSDELDVYYSFNTVSGSVVPVESGNPIHYLDFAGHSLVAFGAESGSGLFSGYAGKINDSESLLKDDFTLLMIFERVGFGEQILFSSFTGSPTPSGFILGLNDANKLFITTYDPVSAAYPTNTFSLNLQGKNGIALSKDNNNFSLLKYVFSEGQFYQERVEFNDNCLTNGPAYFLGGTSVDGSTLPFTGYIDEFAILNSSFGIQSLGNLFSGFVTPEPSLIYGLENSFSNYSYQNLTTLKDVKFESVPSGLFDLIYDSIFNITGVGTVNVLGQGNILSDVAHFSGYMSGTVSLPTGYIQTNQVLTVTGYTSSGQVASATGITGYISTLLNPFVISGDSAGNPDIYTVEALSGISGVTQYTDFFTGPLYQTGYVDVYIPSSIIRQVYQPFDFYYTGAVTGNVNYTYLGKYTNNGDDKILITQDLSYSGSLGQPQPFRVLKTTYLDYGYFYAENTPDDDFIKTFKANGVTLTKPWPTGVITELVFQDFSGIYSFNNIPILDYSSGDFKTLDQLESGNLSLYVNGIHLASNIADPNALLTEDLFEILTEDGDVILVDESGVDGAQYYYLNKYFKAFLSFDRADTAILDNVSGMGILRNFQSAEPLSMASGAQHTAQDNEYWFINGQKLISGLEYTYNSGFITLNTNQYSGIGGILYSIRPNTGDVYSYHREPTGGFLNGVSITGVDFPPRSSQVYLNGVRQVIDEDYVETYSGDLIYGINQYNSLNQIFQEYYEEVYNSQNIVI